MIKGAQGWLAINSQSRSKFPGFGGHKPGRPGKLVTLPVGGNDWNTLRPHLGAPGQQCDFVGLSHFFGVGVRVASFTNPDRSCSLITPGSNVRWFRRAHPYKAKVPAQRSHHDSSKRFASPDEAVDTIWFLHALLLT